MPTTVKIWHFMIRQIGDCAIPLLYHVTRGSPDDEATSVRPKVHFVHLHCIVASVMAVLSFVYIAE